MWRSTIASLGSAVNAVGSAVSAVGRAIDSALSAVAGSVLSLASAIAPKAPPTSQPPDPSWYDGGAGVCPGGRNWRGPFPALDDAREYQSDIPVPSYIYRYVDGWWLYVPDTR